MVNISGAITAAPLADEAEARRWFTLLQQTYEEAGSEGWSAFCDALERQADHDHFDRRVVEEFRREMESNVSDPIEEVRSVHELGDDAVYTWVDACTGHADEEQQAESETAEGSGGYDEAAWYSFLAENGPRWNGEEEAWAGFAEWFLYLAGQAGLAQPAHAFIAYAAAEPDKPAVFRAYGIAVPSSEAAVHDAPAPDPGDVAAALLDESQVAELASALADDGVAIDQLDAGQLEALIREAAAEALAQQSGAATKE